MRVPSGAYPEAHRTYDEEIVMAWGRNRRIRVTGLTVEPKIALRHEAFVAFATDLKSETMTL